MKVCSWQCCTVHIAYTHKPTLLKTREVNNNLTKVSFPLFFACGSLQNWVAFVAIADHTETYYDVSTFAVNMLSTVFMIASLVTGLGWAWLLDTLGVGIGVSRRKLADFMKLFVLIHALVLVADNFLQTDWCVQFSTTYESIVQICMHTTTSQASQGFFL